MDRRSLLAGIAAVTTPFVPGLARASSAHDDLSWRDAARGRDLPLRVRWPDGSAACGLVIHSHGLGGSREGGDVFGRAWRDAGLAVIHVQHPGSDRETLREGVAALRRAASADQLLARVGDLRFVLDEVLRRAREPGAPWARVQPDAIGASGHSFGAQTVLGLAGKAYPRRGPVLAEPRFAAFAAFSPAPGRGEPRAAGAPFGDLQRPLLLLTGSLDGDPLGQAFGGEDRARVYDGLPAGRDRRALLWLDGADHMTFGGNGEQRIAGLAGPNGRARATREPREARTLSLEAAHHALIARITALWWRGRLLGDAQARDALRSPAGLGPGDRWQAD